MNLFNLPEAPNLTKRLIESAGKGNLNIGKQIVLPSREGTRRIKQEILIDKKIIGMYSIFRGPEQNKIKCEGKIPGFITKGGSETVILYYINGRREDRNHEINFP